MKTAMQELIEWIDNDFRKQSTIPTIQQLKNKAKYLLEKEKEQIGQFMNWFIKHYSTATIDGMFGWVDSMEKEVTLKEILDNYYSQNK